MLRLVLRSLVTLVAVMPAVAFPGSPGPATALLSSATDRSRQTTDIFVTLRNPTDETIVLLGRAPVRGEYHRVAAQVKRPNGWRTQVRTNVHVDGTFRVRVVAPVGRSRWRVEVDSRFVSRVVRVRNRVLPSVESALSVHPRFEGDWQARWQGKILQPHTPELESPAIRTALQQWTTDGWNTVDVANSVGGDVALTMYYPDELPQLRVLVRGTEATLPRTLRVARPAVPAVTSLDVGGAREITIDPDLSPAVRLRVHGAPDSEAVLYVARPNLLLLTRDAQGDRAELATEFMLLRLPDGRSTTVEAYPDSSGWIRAAAVPIPELPIGSTVEVPAPVPPARAELLPPPRLLRVVGDPGSAFQVASTNGCFWAPTTSWGSFLPWWFWPILELPGDGVQLFYGYGCTDPASPATVTISSAPSPF